MNDPAELSSEARSLIREGLTGLNPDDNDRSRLREKLAGLVALSATSATATSATAATAMTGKVGASVLSGAAIKLLALVVVGTAAVTWAVHHNSPANSANSANSALHPTPDAPRPTPAVNVPVERPIIEQEASDDAAEVPNERQILNRPTTLPTAIPDAVSIALESAAIASIEESLRAHNFAEARAQAQAFRTSFPSGQLREENDALAAIAACSENDNRARALRNFRRRYPSSFMLQRVSAACANSSELVSDPPLQ